MKSNWAWDIDNNVKVNLAYVVALSVVEATDDPYNERWDVIAETTTGRKHRLAAGGTEKEARAYADTLSEGEE